MYLHFFNMYVYIYISISIYCNMILQLNRVEYLTLKNCKVYVSLLFIPCQ